MWFCIGFVSALALVAIFVVCAGVELMHRQEVLRDHYEIPGLDQQRDGN